MVASSVRVVLRARPSDHGTQINYQSDKKGVSIVQQKVIEGRPGVQQPGAQNYQFKFDNVLDTASQEQVYEATAAEVVQGALEGFNGTIMCYGQTGAGKTFTMSGGKQNFKQRGIIPRALGQIFTEIKSRPDVAAKVSIQFLEIYNEALYDLLDITTQPHEISIYESSRGLVTVSGLRTAVVGSEAEALALLFEGETNRVIGEHQLNRESSRSHSIFTITMELKPIGEAPGDVLVSKLALVDLAGSERVSKTKSEGLVLREAGHINKSLSILEQVILGLGDKGRDHVPFRSSKLTHVLKNSLGGNCRTVLIANVWADAAQTDETLSTCRFAQRMLRVTCEVSANVVQDSSARVRQLERQVQELQQELSMHDAMAMRSNVQYTPYSDVQRTELRSRVMDFLMGEGAGAASGPGGPGAESIEPLELHSLRHMREILLACRHLYREALRSGGTAPRMPAPGGPSMPPATSGPAALGSAPPHARPPSATASPPGPGGATPPGVSVMAARRPGSGSAASPGPSLAAGAAAAAARERRWSEQSSGDGGLRPGSASGGVLGGDGDGAGVGLAERLLSHQAAGSSGAAAGVVAPDRLTALEDYKVGPGQLKARLLGENRAKLRAGKTRAKELGLSINAAKRELDSLKAREDEMKRQRVQQRGEGSQVLDAEEYDILMRIRELKGAYKEHYNELQMTKSEVDYMQGLVDQCNKELLLEFAEWYERTYGRPPADDGGGYGGSVDGDYDGGGYGGGLPSPPYRGGAGGQRSAGPSSAGGPYTTPTLPPLASASPAPSRGAVTPPSPSGSVMSAASGASGFRVLGGPGAAAATAANGARPRPGAGKAPLSSLVGMGAGGGGDEASSPEAMAYYNAQQGLLLAKAGGHRPGSVKKTRPTPGFGTGSPGAGAMPARRT
ncbi:hypothetical protein HYH03_002727 [Edaphochlamys debaryana]|uniref:Kinesin-like protein n=1 Tax=Edaphochlamys debaryana TaxID=47281 RepID=A0A835YK39_9CHLO|nr:hypothetical protein HYH03_002727 [Edaphochlamys debaryana]|eukprot:KAG2499144.1 hypothetical protein HYH03_002727 [Edaphochlamys debaryana]